MAAVLLSSPPAFGANDFPAFPERSETKRSDWYWYYGVSPEQVSQFLSKNKGRLTDIEVERTNPLRFSVAMVENASVHKTGWWWYYGKTAKQVNQLVKDNKARILDIERYGKADKTRFAVIFVPNHGARKTGWWWYYGQSPEKLAQLLKQNNARLVDIDIEQTSPLRFTAIMVSNSGKNKSGWWWYYGKTMTQANALAKKHKARILDIERYGDRFAFVLVPNSGNRSKYWWWYTGVEAKPLLEVARRHGSRVIDIERSGNRFTALLLDNGFAKTGKAVSQLSAFERRLGAAMKRYGIPGASIAVARNGKLVLARGVGLDDLTANKPVQPVDRMRIASISKPITRSAIFKLEEAGKLSLSDKVFVKHLGHLVPSSPKDSRIKQITVQHLLKHKAGWDNEKLGFDPMFYSNEVADALGTPRPSSCENVIRYMLKHHKLNYKPGTESHYSNFGYCVLGRLIKKVSGQSYEQYVKQAILKSAGVKRMRIGSTRKTASAEVKCYHHPFSKNVSSVFPDGPKYVPCPYGSFYLEAMDSHGGWISSSVDLVRFGHKANPAPYGGNWSFNGSLPGTRSRLVRTQNGNLIMAVVFNSRPKDDKAFGKAVTDALNAAANDVETWPSHDLFPQIP